MAFALSRSWHEGENEIHKLTKVDAGEDDPTSQMLAPRAAYIVQRYSLMALGTLDAEDRPWCTVWGGDPPFVQPVAEGLLGIKTTVDASYDPVAKALFKGRTDGEVVREEGAGRMISGLSIELMDRSRWKLYGRMMAGALSATENDSSEEVGQSGEVQLVWKIDQSLGNCPKYLNRKKISSHTPHPKLISDSSHLCTEALDLIAQADLFFISSAHEHEDMDCNHRGGPAGFIRVLQPTSSSEASTIVWPEYSGNNLYQTLGNLMTTPRAGLCIPNFTTGDVLYLTGTTEVLVGEPASTLISKTNLAVKLHITAAILVHSGLPFRGTPPDDTTQGLSPYNPRIRYLSTEKQDTFSSSASPTVTAKLIKKTTLTPTITRYRFSLSDPTVFGPWLPGQYVAFDFSDEMSMGYRHMADDDPTSLNDDYLRTFTVSSPAGRLGVHGEEFEITVRKVGSVTRWLSWQREGAVEVGVRGFGGEFRFDQSGEKGHAGSKRVGFVAAGIGITPLMGLMEEVVWDSFSLVWSVGIKDVGLVVDMMKDNESLRTRSRVFLTGDEDLLDEGARKTLNEVMRMDGLDVRRKRLEKVDLKALDGDMDQWYLCTAPAMRKTVQEWLPGRSIVYENYDY